MSSPKSAVISFRLPVKLIEEADKYAKADKCKNISAWCQKQILTVFNERINQAADDVNSCKQFQSDVAGESAAAIAKRQERQLCHVRKNQIRFFETLFVGTVQETAFYEQLLESEVEWEEITAAAAPAQPTDEFAEFGSFVEEMSNVAEKMIDPFSGEELVVQRAGEEKIRSIRSDDKQSSEAASVRINQPAEATNNLTEINRVDNSPVQ